MGGRKKPPPNIADLQGKKKGEKEGVGFFGVITGTSWNKKNENVRQT